MQNTSAFDWYAREVARLQDEIALLIRFLGAMHMIGTRHADTKAHGLRTTTHPHPPRLQHTHDARMGTPAIAADQVTP